MKIKQTNFVERIVEIQKIMLVGAFFLLFQLFTSCIYNSNEIYENIVIKNPSSPEIGVVNLDLNSDTIFFYGSQKIQFNFTSSNQKIQGVRLLVDTTVIQTISSNSGTFSFDIYSISNGLHTITMQVFTESGTGSIADKLNSESFLFSKNWALVVDNTNVNKVTYTAENGYLKLSWKKYRTGDFAAYRVSDGNLWGKHLVYGTTVNPYFSDSTYYGQYSEYNIDIVCKDGTTKFWGSITVPRNMPAVGVFANSRNEYYAYWNKSKYYRAIDKYNVYANSDYPYIVNGTDSLRRIYLKFGESLDLKLEPIPIYKRPTYTSGNSYNQTSLSTYGGQQTNLTKYSWDYPIYQTGKNSLTYYMNDTVYYYSVTEDKFTKKIPLDIVKNYFVIGSSTYLSPNARYFIFQSSSSNFMTIDLTSLTRYNFTNANQYTGGMSVSLSVTDAGTWIIPNLNGGNSLYSYTQGSSIGSVSTYPNSPSNIKMSPDGKYAIYDRFDSIRAVQVIVPGTTGNKLIWSARSSSANVNRYEFNPINSNQFLVWGGGKITIYQCSPFQKVYEFSFSETLINVDYYNNQFLSASSNRLFVRNLLDGSLVEEIPNFISGTERLRLFNHKVFYQNNFAYYLQQL